MADVPVTLTLTPWYDAKDNPPKTPRLYVTDPTSDTPDRGLAWCSPKSRRWYPPLPVGAPPLSPQPTRYCDPSPPDMSDPLTVRDLRMLLSYIGYSRDWSRVHIEDEGDILARRAAARLRRALDQINTP